MDKKLVYHVDRTANLSNFSKRNTIQVCTKENPYYSNLLFGDKVSFHGDYYLNGLHITNDDPIRRSSALWELFAEIVRLKAFPHLRSRYSAMFGFENPNDLKTFIEVYTGSQFFECNVYALEVTDYLQRDMNLLGSNTQFVVGDPNTYSENLFIKQCFDYWSGNVSNNPLIETLIFGEATVAEVIELREFKLLTKNGKL